MHISQVTKPTPLSVSGGYGPIRVRRTPNWKYSVSKSLITWRGMPSAILVFAGLRPTTVTTMQAGLSSCGKPPFETRRRYRVLVLSFSIVGRCSSVSRRNLCDSLAGRRSGLHQGCIEISQVRRAAHTVLLCVDPVSLRQGRAPVVL